MRRWCSAGTPRFFVSCGGFTWASSPWRCAFLSDVAYAAQDRGDAAQYRLYREAMDAIAADKVASASSFFSPAPGELIVDVGVASGTSSALLACLFPEQQVVGVDVNEAMIDAARQTYPPTHYPNLRFRLDDGETLETFSADGAPRTSPGTDTVHGFFNCACLHHVTSFNGYDVNRAVRALRRQAALLGPRGVIVVRDFPRMGDEVVRLDLRAEATPEQKARGQPSDADLLVRFSHEARDLAPEGERGFPLEELPPPPRTPSTELCRAPAGVATPTFLPWRSFRLLYSDATEFIRRKDYWSDWSVELHEEYGYLTQKQFEQVFRDMGMRVVLSAPLYNEWILKHRYRHRLRLFRQGATAGTAGGGETHWDDMGLPPTNYLIAAEKVGTRGGTQLRVLRHLPSLTAADSYLRYEEYRHKITHRVFELVRRPHPVVDLLPFYTRPRHATEGQAASEVHDEGDSADELCILAKHGYPRPLLSLFSATAGEGVLTSLDGKTSGGYVTECLAVADGPLTSLIPVALLGQSPRDDATGAKHSAETLRETVASTLEARCGLPARLCESADVLHPVYFPSPGGVSECVSSLAVRLSPTTPATTTWTLPHPMPDGFSGFREAGSLRAFKASQLLLSAQTGALVEARLEVNVYRLFHKLGRELPRWLGEVFDAAEEPRPPLHTCTVEEMLALAPEAHFEPYVPDTTTPGPASDGHRARSFLMPQRAMFTELGVVGSIGTVEYVVPRQLSSHTVSTLPLHRTVDGACFVGLELRDLPVPQLYDRRRDRATPPHPDCHLWSLPARRLPVTVTSLHEVELFLRDPAQHRLDGTRTVIALQPLGHMYCPSLGVSPEQVHPYVVSLSTDTADTAAAQSHSSADATAAPSGSVAPRLHWVSLEALTARMDLLEDGHLVLALSRLQHMLSKGAASPQ